MAKAKAELRFKAGDIAKSNATGMKYVFIEVDGKTYYTDERCISSVPIDDDIKFWESSSFFTKGWKKVGMVSSPTIMKKLIRKFKELAKPSGSGKSNEPERKPPMLHFIVEEMPTSHGTEQQIIDPNGNVIVTCYTSRVEAEELCKFMNSSTMFNPQP